MTEYGKYERYYREDCKVCGEPYPEFVRFFTDYSKQSASILDLGCGQGRDALMVARRGHSVLGVDISPTGIQQMIEDADAEGLSIRGIVADLTEYEVRERFDVILFDRILHMLDVQQQVHLLAKALRHVLPYGYVLIADMPSNKPRFKHAFEQDEDGWSSTLDRKGFLFMQRDRC